MASLGSSIFRTACTRWTVAETVGVADKRGHCNQHYCASPADNHALSTRYQIISNSASCGPSVALFARRSFRHVTLNACDRHHRGVAWRIPLQSHPQPRGRSGALQECEDRKAQAAWKGPSLLEAHAAPVAAFVIRSEFCPMVCTRSVP
jgi:hypothetical protein